MANRKRISVGKYVDRVGGNAGCKEHFYVPCTLDEYGRVLQSEMLSFLCKSKIGNAYYFRDWHRLICVVEYYIDEEKYCGGAFGDATVLDVIPDWELTGWETITDTNGEWEVHSNLFCKDIRLIEPNKHGNYRYFHAMNLREVTMPDEIDYAIKLTTFES